MKYIGLNQSSFAKSEDIFLLYIHRYGFEHQKSYHLICCDKLQKTVTLLRYYLEVWISADHHCYPGTDVNHFCR